MTCGPHFNFCVATLINGRAENDRRSSFVSVLLFILQIRRRKGRRNKFSIATNEFTLTHTYTRASSSSSTTTNIANHNENENKENKRGNNNNTANQHQTGTYVTESGCSSAPRTPLAVVKAWFDDLPSFFSFIVAAIQNTALLWLVILSTSRCFPSVSRMSPDMFVVVLSCLASFAAVVCVLLLFALLTI